MPLNAQNQTPKPPRRRTQDQAGITPSPSVHASVKPGEKPTLLVVDDESEIREIIADLVSENYDTIQAADAEEAIKKARREKPSLILLDIMMPGKNGIETCAQLRQDPQTRHIPIIMLTGAANVDNRIQSFTGGADDFVAKPFNAEELMSRIASKIRRSRERPQKQAHHWQCGNLRLNKREPFALLDGRTVQLTPAEHSILAVFVKNPDTLIARSQVMKAWVDKPEDDRLIDAHLTSLRKKLVGFTGQIRAVYGKGYILTTDSGPLVV